MYSHHALNQDLISSSLIKTGNKAPWIVNSNFHHIRGIFISQDASYRTLVQFSLNFVRGTHPNQGSTRCHLPSESRTLIDMSPKQIPFGLNSVVPEGMRILSKDLIDTFQREIPSALETMTGEGLRKLPKYLIDRFAQEIAPRLSIAIKTLGAVRTMFVTPTVMLTEYITKEGGIMIITLGGMRALFVKILHQSGLTRTITPTIARH